MATLIRTPHPANPLSIAVLLFGSGCAVLDAPTVDTAEPEPVLTAAGPVAPQAPNRFELAYAGQSVIGEPQLVRIDGDNTLSDLAREYGLGYDEIVAANPGVDPWLPGEGTPVLLPTQYILPSGVRSGIVLNVASKRLFWFPEPAAGESRLVYTFPIGVGRVGWETPTGSTVVVAKAKDPNWYVPLSVREEHEAMGDPLPAVVPPGPDNPLGNYVLKLDMPGYLIHGTNQPYGVGMRVSHGCVRLYPENIEFLFPEIGNGTAVTIVNEPYLLGERDGELFFEGHAPLEDDTETPEHHLDVAFERFAEEYRVQLPVDAEQHIHSVASAGHGVAVRVYDYDADEYLARAIAVTNTVEPDPDAPTLDEVRDMIDEVMAAETEEDVAADAVGAAE